MMFISSTTISFLAISLLCLHLLCKGNKLYSVFDRRLLSKHEISGANLHRLLKDEHYQYNAVESPHLICGDATDVKNKVNSLRNDHGDQISSLETAFINKNHDTSCLLAHMPSSLAKRKMEAEDGWTYHPLPHILKIHHSVVDFLSNSMSDDNAKNTHIVGPLANNDKFAEESTLSFHFSLGALKSSSMKSLTETIFATSQHRRRQLTESTVIDGSAPWKSVVEIIKKKALDDSIATGVNEDSTDCSLPPNVISEYFEQSVSFSNLTGMKLACFVELIQSAAISPSILRVSISKRPILFNFEARGMLQSGIRYIEPYSEIGLDGSGQIVGIADSGLNDLSCFFIDDSNSYSTGVTNRAGVLEPLRRKVIQYAVEADMTDDEGGHGTHVAGTVAGFSNEFSMNNGMAPAAKIAFYDIGVSKKSYLMVPPLSTVLFPKAYDAGARIHTNSWGDLGGLYGQSAYSVDSFAHSHPDMLLIFAAGNSGDTGIESCGAPSIAKNSLGVGCEQVHDTVTDEVHPELTLAYFSSIGPTYDGRIKPDVIGPGDYLMSAFSGPTEAVEAAVAMGSSAAASSLMSKSTCAVHQMSGTSMAAPSIAGMALLIRQYFMDSKFWASFCNPAYSSCLKGAFTPSGYFLKAVLIHSGQAMQRYSTHAYDHRYASIPSFALGPPPDSYQGYGAVRLNNVLPLEIEGGLDPILDLVVWDELPIKQGETLRWKIRVSNFTTEPIRITICWYDPPAPIFSSSNILLHDLDLLVVDPTGKQSWGNRVEGGDASNPNERVVVSRPHCSKKVCDYIVYVHAHTLTETETQNFAMIITTSGVVNGPTNSHEAWLASPSYAATAAPTAPLEQYTVAIKGAIAGGEYLKEYTAIETCGVLEFIDVSLAFDPLNAKGSLPMDMQFVIIDPTSTAMSIGGTDLSYPGSTFTTPWPDNFDSGGVSVKGVFDATMRIVDMNLHSPGQWGFYLLNAMSDSSNVSYDFRVTLRYQGGVVSCSPSSTPTVQPTWLPTVSAAPTSQPTLSGLTPLKLTIDTVKLAVTNLNGKYSGNTVLLASFPYTGTLKRIKISVNDDKVGGAHTWYSGRNSVYRRGFPDTWSRAPHTGNAWETSRDVSPGEIVGYADQGEWTVELVLGTEEEELAMTVTGQLTLFFDQDLMMGGSKKGGGVAGTAGGAGGKVKSSHHPTALTTAFPSSESSATSSASSTTSTSTTSSTASSDVSTGDGTTTTTPSAGATSSSPSPVSLTPTGLPTGFPTTSSDGTGTGGVVPESSNPPSSLPSNTPSPSPSPVPLPVADSKPSLPPTTDTTSYTIFRQVQRILAIITSVALLLIIGGALVTWVFKSGSEIVTDSTGLLDSNNNNNNNNNTGVVTHGGARYGSVSTNSSIQ